MKKRLLTGLAIGMYVLSVVGMASAEIYGGIDFPDGAVSFADEWILYEPTSDVLPPHNDPTLALGVPDRTSGGANTVSLGDEGF